MAEIQRALRDAANDSSVHGVIVTGAGDKSFVAGAAITEIASVSPQQAQAFTRHGQAVFDLVETLGKPVIAAVNGNAPGGGCELAMACTLRIAAENASFGQPEVKLGVMPGFGGTQRVASARRSIRASWRGCRACASAPPRAAPWAFREAGRAFTVGVQGPLDCNLAAPMLEACAAGLGFVRCLSYQAAPLVAAKHLRIVLGDYEVEPWPVSLTYPSARLLPSRTKVFIEWMAGEMKSLV